MGLTFNFQFLILNLKARLEVLWWIATAVLLITILFPILMWVPHYPFLFSNILFVVVFVTLTRYIFLLKHAFWARWLWLKAVLIFTSIIFIIFLLEHVVAFQAYIQDNGFMFLDHLHIERRNRLASYVRTEMLFFGVGSIIVTAIFPIRMIISIWRQKNRGTV